MKEVRTSVLGTVPRVQFYLTQITVLECTEKVSHWDISNLPITRWPNLPIAHIMYSECFCCHYNSYITIRSWMMVHNYMSLYSEDEFVFNAHCPPTKVCEPPLHIRDLGFHFWVNPVCDLAYQYVKNMLVLKVSWGMRKNVFGTELYRTISILDVRKLNRTGRISRGLPWFIYRDAVYTNQCLDNTVPIRNLPVFISNIQGDRLFNGVPQRRLISLKIRFRYLTLASSVALICNAP